MKFYIILLTLSFGIIFFSCTKTSNQAGSTIPVVTGDTTPLPGTVAKTDTLMVMAYNVLNYGDGCQGPTGSLDPYLKTIVQYARPDLLSCEKMAPFPMQPGAVGNSADEIRDSALNAAFPGQYAYATPTDVTNDSKMSVLFYNKQKLTCVYTKTLVADISDFDLYKLYYNDVNLAITHDTTFIYVIVNHTQSGTGSAARDRQDAEVMKALHAKFAYLPNLVNMGDFNTHSSQEPGYQAVTSGKDTTQIMFDPPFYPDKKVQYPAMWESQTSTYAPYFTTSTRGSINFPNSCGTGDGAKSWYDHLFISSWLVNGGNYMQYLPGSYTTIGNDGNRMGVAINSTTPVVNNSAPANVLDALWQFSNKYPVSVKLIVKANRSGSSPADPMEKN